jgi:GNAT superfamily N-acetyltransferase
MITISSDKSSVQPSEAAALYIELGWGDKKRYSATRLRRSLTNCDIVVSARNEEGDLIGITRALSDFALETKILDMVIDPDYQRQGVGRRMMQRIESLARGTTFYCETEWKNFRFVETCGYGKRPALTVFRKMTKKR